MAGRSHTSGARTIRAAGLGLAGALWLLAAGTALTPAAAQADRLGRPSSDTVAAGHGRSGMELSLSAAVLAPLTDLAPASQTRGSLQLSTGAGLRADGIWWLGSGLGVALGGIWVPVDLDREAMADGGTDDPDPGGKVGEADYLAGTVELVVALPPVSEQVRTEPFLVAGAGLRRLSIDADDGLPGGITDPTATVGGGFRMLLSPRLLLRLEALDRIAPAEVGAETRIQHDLSVSVGLGVRP